MIQYHPNLIQGSDEWLAARCGLLTASELLATLATKATFTEEQKARVLSLKPKAEDATPASPPAQPPAVDDDFVRDMDAATQEGAK